VLTRYTLYKNCSSAKKLQIPANNIYVVVGESDDETDIIKTYDFNIIFCKYINIDYNGIIYFTQTECGLNELLKYTHFFYTHDTTCFIENFWEKIKNYSQKCESYIKLQDGATKNIGLINVDWFIKHKKELFSYYINYDKSLKIDYKSANFPNKDFIYSKFKNLPRWLNEDSVFLFDDNFEPMGDFFKNDHLHQFIKPIYNNSHRLGTVYNEPGIIKFQANWGQSDTWNLEL
jgi:hypothetical protein